MRIATASAKRQRQRVLAALRVCPASDQPCARRFRSWITHGSASDSASAYFGGHLLDGVGDPVILFDVGEEDEEQIHDLAFRVISVAAIPEASSAIFLSLAAATHAAVRRELERVLPGGEQDGGRKCKVNPIAVWRTGQKWVDFLESGKTVELMTRRLGPLASSSAGRCAP